MLVSPMGIACRLGNQHAEGGGPQEKAQKVMKNQYSKSLLTHGDAELGQASENVGTLYHLWSAAAEELIVKSSAPGNTNS